LSGQSRHQVVPAICKSLLDEKVFSLDVAQLPQATPEDIKIGTPGLTTNFQPANAGNPTGTLRPRSRCGEQAYGNGKNPEPLTHQFRLS
jgi:hypothetical protein